MEFKFNKGSKVIHADKNVTVIVTGAGDNSFCFAGVVIESNDKTHKVGEYSESWYQGSFLVEPEEVTEFSTQALKVYLAKCLDFIDAEIKIIESAILREALHEVTNTEAINKFKRDYAENKAVCKFISSLMNEFNIK